ncbi:MAG TPA: histidine kinase [Terracidiphilus sp.]|jgi:signal transduction histidine kinase|nr:histidine kinase [Terracidiphilus sp.]
MNRTGTKRSVVLVLLAVAGIAMVAGAVFAYRSIAEKEPMQHQAISLEKQDAWQAFGGTWQYLGGVMTNNSDERGAKLMTGPGYWTNYSVEADVLLLGQYGDAGLIIRASDEETGVDAYHGYMAGLRDLDNTLMMGRADYGWREYAAMAVSPRVFAGQWYHIKFLAFDCDFAVSATSHEGKTTTLAIRDPGCIKAGRFGLKSYNTGAQWRNVETRPATQSDLRAMIGNLQPELAVPSQLPSGMEPATRDRYLEPIERDLQAHRSAVNAEAISGLRVLSPDASSSVTVQGVVTLTSPMLYLQDSTGGIAISSSHPHAPLQIGDEIEAKGDATLHDFSSEMRNADIHLLWSHTPVSPVAVAASQAATGTFDAQYVEVQGRLEDVHEDSDGAETLTLEDGSQSFVAIVNGLGRSPQLRTLKKKSTLRLRGICVTDSKYTHDLTAFALLLPSSEDIEVAEGPPWWSPAHIFGLVLCMLLLSFAGMMGFFLVERWRMQAVLDERQRLAHEMHDTLAQSFAGLGFQLQAIRDDVKDGLDITPQLAMAQDMVRTSHEEARRSISALRPEHLESVGLLSALGECAHRMISQCASIEIVTVSEGTAQNIPLRVSDTLLRIGYEAIANAIRHAHCSRIKIAIVYRQSTVEMIVEDDGVGFVVSSDSAGFGIRGMQKRADNISAHCRIESAPGHGTAVHVLVPLPPSFLQALSRRWFIQMRKTHVERVRS